MRPLSVIFVGYAGACVAAYFGLMIPLALEQAAHGAPRPWLPIVRLFGVALPVILVIAAPGFILLRTAIAIIFKSPSFVIFAVAGGLNATVLVSLIQVPVSEFAPFLFSGAVGGLGCWWAERATLRLRARPAPEEVA